MIHSRSKALFTLVLGATLSAAPLMAQTTNDNPNPTNPNTNQTSPGTPGQNYNPASPNNYSTNTPNYNNNTPVEHRGFDWGWLGLFGLLGLIGRRRGTVGTTAYDRTTATRDFGTARDRDRAA